MGGGIATRVRRRREAAAAHVAGSWRLLGGRWRSARAIAEFAAFEANGGGYAEGRFSGCGARVVSQMDRSARRGRRRGCSSGCLVFEERNDGPSECVI
ncbi:MAG: hypothetical protein R3B46_01650 [Phycisphaerales bacterium]